MNCFRCGSVIPLCQGTCAVCGAFCQRSDGPCKACRGICENCDKPLDRCESREQALDSDVERKSNEEFSVRGQFVSVETRISFYDLFAMFIHCSRGSIASSGFSREIRSSYRNHARRRTYNRRKSNDPYSLPSLRSIPSRFD